ncbi:MAG: hypothetical protein WC812_03815 [Candidatus Pacearchaeota archaeon]|jgi:hypothetical protein
MKVVYNKIQEQLIEESFYSRSSHLDENSKLPTDKVFILKEKEIDKGNLSKSSLQVVWNKRDLIEKILDRKME